MRLTTFTDYALRVLLHVATAPGRRTTIAAIASAYGISANHLVKVVHLLGKEGFLYNTRGRRGGLTLAASPSAINVGAVVRATEGPSLLAECFGPGGRCAIESSCRLQRVLREADEAFFEVLDRYTLQDLLARPARMVAILHPDEINAPGVFR
ncbi:MAG TPA: Rrf2 family transcriptional regulator [Usitatibacter sp.]|jgi:Rrf2 family nitric oxide-sensitive transcriptional repressor|nr:Rrf2 family transcriptional regulator [Usitatibacter sp.]